VRQLVVTGLLALACATAAQAASTTLIVEGRGWGHGVGMSQHGAQGFALAGWDHRRILAYYYRGTRVERVPGRTVRVLLVAGRTQVRIGSRKALRVRLADGRWRRLPPGMRVLRATTLRAGERLYVPGAAPLRVNGAPYRGRLRVYAANGRLAVVNEVSLELYLRGVVPGEMPYDWAPEALQAQAVVARTYALARRAPGRRFDLYDDVRSQVYGGLRVEREETTRAVTATSGEIVTWNGHPAETYYHSSSGGRTANVRDVWPAADPVPYLRSVPDPYDRLSVYHRWGPIAFTPRALGRKLGLARVEDVRVERGPGGRAAAVEVVGPRTVQRLDASEFRRRLGLRSTWFTVRVLRLEPEPAGRAVRLRGFVRGGGPVFLERRDEDGWERVRRLRLAPNGRFLTRVAPERPTRYRLVVGDAASAAVRILTGR
jgi:stage II sporulation protein D